MTRLHCALAAVWYVRRRSPCQMYYCGWCRAQRDAAAAGLWRKYGGRS